MKRALVVAAIVALLWGGVSYGVDEPAGTPEAFKKALSPDLIVIQEERHAEADQPLVIVVGENHASVKTQIQLATLVGRLLDQGLIDAILVEGSSGPFDIAPLFDQIAQLHVSNTELDTYWRQQLEAGRVAGYEYVALTRPGLQVFGVENMGAKARYEAGYQARESEQMAETYDRAVEALEREFSLLAQNAKAEEAQKVRRSIDELKSSRDRFAPIPGEMAKKLEPLIPLVGELAELRVRLASLYLRLNSASPSLDDYTKWLRMAEVSGARESVGLAEKISDFERKHREDLEQLVGVIPKINKSSEELDKAQEQLAPYFEQVTAITTEMEDRFFIAANGLQSLATGTGMPRPAVMKFFKEEKDRQERERTLKERTELAERDRAMVENTVKYLQESTKKRVLLIVGYAHLVGITEDLPANNLSFISGKLRASEEEIEPWEEKAWEFRKRANRSIFTVSRPELKELSPLLSQPWRKEQVARLEYFRQMEKADSPLKPSLRGLAWKSKIYEKVGTEDRALVIGEFPLDRNADVGSHIADQGAVPGKPGQFYRVFDRKTAGELVKEYSNESISFVYCYKTVTSQSSKSRYQFITPSGRKSLSEFMSKPPAQAEYVVRFGEPDEVQEGGLVLSPLQQELRGGKQPPSGPPPWTSALASSGDPHRPILLQTNNVSRARRNVEAVKRQQSSRLGDIEFIEERDLSQLDERLMFTPSGGDHAQIVVFTGGNTQEFRAAIRRAAQAQLLQGKQVALITCGDAFADTAALKEELLRGGVLMVWVNDRQIRPEAAQRLRDEGRKVVQKLPVEKRNTIDQIMNQALKNWRKSAPSDPGHKSFMRAGSWVDLRSWDSPWGKSDSKQVEKAG